MYAHQANDARTLENHYFVWGYSHVERSRLPIARVCSEEGALAYTVAAELGEIRRSSSPKELVGYSGLCPKVYPSGGKDHRGSLSENGPKYLPGGCPSTLGLAPVVDLCLTSANAARCPAYALARAPRTRASGEVYAPSQRGVGTRSRTRASGPRARAALAGHHGAMTTKAEEASPAPAPSPKLMPERRRIALIAHDNRKVDLLEWARYNRLSLAGHDLVATGTTGKLLSEELGLQVSRVESGPLGGDVQIAAMITEGKVDVLVFFWDPLEPQPHDPDVKALLRVAVVWNIPAACNRATADFLISSPLMAEPYERATEYYGRAMKPQVPSDEGQRPEPEPPRPGDGRRHQAGHRP